MGCGCKKKRTAKPAPRSRTNENKTPKSITSAPTYRKGCINCK